MPLLNETADAPDAIVVLTSVATTSDAAALVRALLERRLVACGTVLPGARSIYRWESEVKEEAEAVVMLKTQRDRLPALKRAVDELHPYDVPELLALAVEDGSRAYLAWVTAETATPPSAVPRAD